MQVGNSESKMRDEKKAGGEAVCGVVMWRSNPNSMTSHIIERAPI